MLFLLAGLGAAWMGTTVWHSNYKQASADSPCIGFQFLISNRDLLQLEKAEENGREQN